MLVNSRNVFMAGLVFSIGMANFSMAQKVYWTDASAQVIRRANLDGTFVEDLRTGVNFRSPSSIAVDANGEKIYVTGECGVYRVSLDGTQVECLVPLVHHTWASSLALDTSAKKLYWAVGGVIQRANLDGSDVETMPLGDPTARPFALAVDSMRGKIYWSDSTAVRRANLDGTQVESIISRASLYTYSLAIDPVDAKLYGAGGGVFRANLDGTQLTHIGGDANDTKEVAIDVAGGRVYWNNYDEIVRANLDGSNPEVFIPNQWGITGMAVVDGHDQLLLASSSADLISRIRLDGTHLEELIRLDLVPQDIAIDFQRGRMFWIDEDRYRLRAADLDGSNPMDLIAAPQIGAPQGVAVEPDNGMLYWTDNVGGIHRAAQDGSNPTRVASALHPLGLVIDPKIQTMYWSQMEGSFRLLSSHLDGSRRLASTVRLPFWFGLGNLALNRINGHLFWTLSSSIERGNIDFSGREDFLAVGAQDIATDELGGWLYWSDVSTSSLRRIKLDRSVTEDLPIGGFAGPVHFALDLRRPGDFDDDHRVDLKDFARIQNCFAGSARPNDPACSFFDGDPADRDVDKTDFAAFVINFGGQ